MSRRQFSEPLSAVSCRQFPNLSIWLRTSWTNPSPSGDVQAASQCCFLTTLMPPLSVFSECFFGLFSYLRANDKIFMSFLWFTMPLPLLLRSCDYCVREVHRWSTPVKGYLYSFRVRIRKVHWVWRFSGAAVLLYCQTDHMSFRFTLQIIVSIAPRAFVSL